ncbi:hypothetical protein [Acinetobacter sp. YH16049]|uniref:hypothetical protein n=1 Tax=Acinetobacter sp. YH16049 TaxID=2601188 RepID=UPI0015D3D52C|nr:hypothetical protein [Acinetobacter sp. YH16049]
MTTPALQTVYSEIIDEMFSEVEKTTSEFKIHSWKRRAEKLKTIDMFQYKVLIAIISAYENDNDLGIRLTKSALALTSNNSKKAMAYRCIGNMSFHIGAIQDSLDAYWTAYQLTYDPGYFASFIGIVTNFVLLDPRIEDMKSLDQQKKAIFQEKIANSIREIEDIEKNNLKLETYRSILVEAFKIYFSYCSGQIHRLTMNTDAHLSTLLFNPELSLELVGKMNEEMSEALVGLLDHYEYEEILKFPIVFTSENHIGKSHKEMISG